MGGLLGSGVELSILLDEEKERPRYVAPRPVLHDMLPSYMPNTYPLYHDGESISGVVVIRCASIVEHQGVKIEFIGEIELPVEEGGRNEFRSLSTTLSAPSNFVPGTTTFQFCFKHIDAPYESYDGQQIKLRYYLKLTINKRFLNDSMEKTLWFHATSMQGCVPPSQHIRMEVCLEDSLQLTFEYPQSVYTLNDVVTGWVHFQLVRIKVRSLELCVIKREFIGEGAVEGYETLGKWRMMEGDVHGGKGEMECIYTHTPSIHISWV